MFKIIVIGISAGMSTAREASLKNCRSAFATSRLQGFLANFNGRVHPISPLSTALEQMDKELAHGDVAVLASGDPLFFGIGRRLLRHFGSKKVQIFPALSALQLVCARFNEPWDDAQLISLHGRDCLNFSARIIQAPKSILLTDREHNPAMIAANLLIDLAKIDADQQDIQIMVAENLGMPQEKICQGSPKEIAGQQFSDLNIIIIKNKIASNLPAHRFGLHEDDIQHSRGLITKDEVRAATLHSLQLPESGVLWDLGAGSGSISIEAARLFPNLAVFALEKTLEGQENIRHNIKRFKLVNLTLVEGQAPEAIAALPDPQRIFIGGSGGLLAEIIARAVPRLSKPGIITVNAVTKNTKEAAPALLHAQGLIVSMSTIQVSRCFFPPAAGAVNFKPITIITGKK